MDASKITSMPELEQQRQMLEEKQKVVRAEFVQVELELAITFCRIALSSRDGQKIERNEAHAQEAHESALRFLSTAQVAEPLKKEIEGKLELLKKLLSELREYSQSGQLPRAHPAITSESKNFLPASIARTARSKSRAAFVLVTNPS